jgi:hypothetical protein
MFTVSRAGQFYWRDLGQSTVASASAMSRFDPDASRPRVTP